MSGGALRSAVLDRGFEKGGDGFYFQHRKGRLDMRTLSKVDVDSIVKNVDIETLQEHLENLCFSQLHEEDLRQYTDPMICKLFRLAQYTIEYLLHVQEQLASTLNALAVKYAKKKRSLLDKRKEMNELKEMTRVLKEQVKNKKKSLGILEDMIKEVGTSKGAEAAPASLPQPAVVKFFVAGPRGVCVEFGLSNATLIKEVVKDAREAFISRRVRGKRADPVLKLMYQGRWLREDTSLEANGIRAGDTLVLSIEDDSDDSDDERIVQPAQPPMVADTHLTDFMKMQSEAYKRMADEMRSGFEHALRSINHTAPSRDASTDPELILRVEEKWTRIELSVRQQLDSQMQHYDNLLKELLTRDKRPIVGELEDDHDDKGHEELMNRLNDSMGKIRSLQTSVDLSDSELGELRKQVRVQSIEIEELKNRLSNSAPTIVYQTVPVPVATPEKPVETVVPQPAPAPVEVAMEPLVLVIPPESIPEPAPTPLEPSEPEEEVVKLLPPEPAHVELEPFVEELDSDDLEIRLTSTIATTSSLGGAVQQEQATVICAVPRDIGTDDLVFELRKAVADQFSIPLGRSALVLDGEVVMLGLDVDQRFSAQTAQKQAAARSLTFQISSGKTITDAQLDVIAETLADEKSNPEFKKSFSLPPGAIPKMSRLEDSKYKKVTKRSWSDDEDDELDDDMHDLKSTLDEALSEVSDRESLSQDEMELKLRKLRKSQSGLNPSLSAHIDSFRKSFSGAMAKAEDSGSDDHFSSDKRAASVGIKLLRRDTTGKSMESLGSTYSSRSSKMFDNDEDDDQFVLMQSINGTPKGIATPSFGNRRGSLNQETPTTSLIIMESPTKPAAHSAETVLKLNTSDASSRSTAKRYSPPDEPIYPDERKSSKDKFDDSYSHVSSISRALDSKTDYDRSIEISESSYSDVQDSKSSIDRSRPSANQTMGSVLSDLTMSGLQEPKGAMKVRSDAKDDDSGSAKLKKSVEFSIGSDDSKSSVGASKVSTKVMQTPPPMSLSARTPLSNSSTVSPFMDLQDGDEVDESLALSESNDAFPYLDESYVSNDSGSLKSSGK